MKSMLRSRERELGAIDQLLADARSGHGAGLILRGEPGIGKSALLAEARQRAGDMHILTATSVEAESALGYATLQLLLRPCIDLARKLPPPQAKALRMALGLTTGDSPDRFLVSLATLNVLSAIAEEQPVLCLLDDAHWADIPSLDVIAFVARRIEAEPIAVLGTTRDDGSAPQELAGIAALQVGGLSLEDGKALLDKRWGAELAPGVRDALAAAADGNPLALSELPRMLTVEQRMGREVLPQPLPVAGELEHIFAAAVEQLEPNARTVALLCAAHGQGSLAVIGRAAASLGITELPLDVPEVERMLQMDGSTVGFKHP